MDSLRTAHPRECLSLKSLLVDQKTAVDVEDKAFCMISFF